MSGRRVSLVLCSRTGELLGKLPAFMIDDPWWPEVRSVIDLARERFAVEVVVLRLVDVVSDTYNGGDVTYLAELVEEPLGDLALTPAPAKINEDQPLRARQGYPSPCSSHPSRPPSSEAATVSQISPDKQSD